MSRVFFKKSPGKIGPLFSDFLPRFCRFLGPRNRESTEKIGQPRTGAKKWVLKSVFFIFFSILSPTMEEEVNKEFRRASEEGFKRSTTNLAIIFFAIKHQIEDWILPFGVFSTAEGK